MNTEQCTVVFGRFKELERLLGWIYPCSHKYSTFSHKSLVLIKGSMIFLAKVALGFKTKQIFLVNNVFDQKSARNAQKIFVSNLFYYHPTFVSLIQDCRVKISHYIQSSNLSSALARL